jgi:hypothetical protein
VDGLQRYTAIKKFINNELKVFDCRYKDFTGRLRMMHDMYINVNDLPSRKDVLRWYIEFNSGGTVHSDDEIERVKKLFEAESK